MKSYRLVPGILAVLCIGIASFSGCGEQTSDAGNVEKKPLPKMDFHKPGSFSAAVSRIREIHDTLVSEGDLPASISYTVKEVSHSHGDGESHVHYHLADTDDSHDHEHCDHDHDDDHGDHDHADPFQPTHRIEVDIFTELKDVAKWMPAIASDGDLPRDSWNVSKEVSEKITGHLDEVVGSSTPSEQRTAYQSDSAAMETWIQELESLVESAVSTTETK